MDAIPAVEWRKGIQRVINNCSCRWRHTWLVYKCSSFSGSGGNAFAGLREALEEKWIWCRGFRSNSLRDFEKTARRWQSESCLHDTHLALYHTVEVWYQHHGVAPAASTLWHDIHIYIYIYIYIYIDPSIDIVRLIHQPDSGQSLWSNQYSYCPLSTSHNL